jgi:acetyl esterase/lipase
LFGSSSQFHFHASFLASKYGFFAISVDYRMSGEATFPAALLDTKCAIRWVRSQAELTYSERAQVPETLIESSGEIFL